VLQYERVLRDRSRRTSPLWLERVGASGEQEEDGGKAVQAGKAQAAALSHFALLSSPP
jgi:hypothetical protein